MFLYKDKSVCQSFQVLYCHQAAAEMAPAAVPDTDGYSSPAATQATRAVEKQIGATTMLTGNQQHKFHLTAIIFSGFQVFLSSYLHINSGGISTS